MAQGSAEEQTVVARWRSFLQSYASGDVPAQGCPPNPGLLPNVPLVDGVAPWKADAASCPLYNIEDDIITDDVARDIAKFYTQHRFLPPPRSIHTSIRDRLVLEYDLFQKDQVRSEPLFNSPFIVPYPRR